MRYIRKALELVYIICCCKQIYAQRYQTGNGSLYSSPHGPRAAECCPAVSTGRAECLYDEPTPIDSIPCTRLDITCELKPYQLPFPKDCEPPPRIECPRNLLPPVCPKGADCKIQYRYKYEDQWQCPLKYMFYKKKGGQLGMDILYKSKTKLKCDQQALRPISSCMEHPRLRNGDPDCNPVEGDFNSCKGYDCEWYMRETEECNCGPVPQHECPLDGVSTCTIMYEYRPHYGCCPAVVMEVEKPGGNKTTERILPKEYVQRCIDENKSKSGGTAVAHTLSLMLALCLFSTVSPVLQYMFHHSSYDKFYHSC